MSVTTSKTLIKSKLSEINDPKRLKKTIVVLELPFVADDQDMKRYFAKCKGGVKSIDIYRSGALIFSSAIIEFASTKGAIQAQELALSDGKLSGSDFDIIVMNAEDFLAGKKIVRKKKTTDGNMSSRDNTQEESSEKKCRVQ